VVENPPERWEPPHATHGGAYPQLRCVSEALAALALHGPYDSTDTRRPQRSVIDHTLDTSGPRATDKCGGGERVVHGWDLVATAGTALHDSLDMNVKGLQLLPDEAFRHSPAQVLHQGPHTAVLREREGMETHPPPI